jgi:hypothetical protein
VKRLIFLVLFFSWPLCAQVKTSGHVKVSGGIFMSGAVASGLGWTDVSGQQITQGNCPSPLPPGDDGCAGVVQAWNSAIVDTTRNCLWVWGGGHSDYAGNEIYNFCLGTGVAQRVNTPTITADLTQCSAAYSDGAPSARHTYGGTVYVPTIDSMMVFGGVFWCTAGGFDTHDTWMLALGSAGGAAVNGWTHISPTCVGDGGNCPNDQNGNSQLQYDPVNEVVYLNDASTGFWMFNPATNTYTFLASGPSDLTIHQNTVIDPVHRLFLRFGDGTGQSISIAAGSTYAETQLTMAGCASLSGGSLAGSVEPGLAWDSVLQVIVAWPNFGPGVYLYNPVTDSCTTATYTPNAPPNSAQAGSPNTTNGTYKRFGYFPAYGEYVLVNDWDIDVHTLRLTPSNPAQNDFEARAYTPGVIRSIQLASASDLSGNAAPGKPRTTCGLVCPAFDSTTAPVPGTGSLELITPAGATSPNTGGSWNIDFLDDFSIQMDSLINGDPESPTTACNGLPCPNEIWIQWRQRFDSGMLQNFANSNGFKDLIVGEGDQPGVLIYSCTDLEIPEENSDQFGIPRMYHSCGVKLDTYDPLTTNTGNTDSHGNGIFSPQNQAGGYLACNYADTVFVLTSQCVPYVANQWMTFMWHVKVAKWYPGGLNGSSPPAPFLHDSTVELYVQSAPGQAFERVIGYVHGATSPSCDAEQTDIPSCSTGYDIANPTAWTPSFTTPCVTGSTCNADGSGNEIREKYGQIWFLNYQTNLNCPACTAAHTWYSQLIISRTQIAAPQY